MSTSLAATDARHAPDLCEPILGYRFWRVARDGSLRCLATRVTWSPGPNRATCWRCAHAAPARLCSCGFNALHEPPVADRDEYRNAVIGALAAWGAVDLHRLGLRAEYATVVALAERGVAHPPPRRRLEQSAARYGVALVPLEELAVEASRFALPVDRSLIPGRGPLPRFGDSH